MPIRFCPSLQQIAYVRVAQGILYTFDLEQMKKKYSLHDNLWRMLFVVRIKAIVSGIVMPTFPTNSGHYSTSQSNSEQIKYEVIPPDVQTLLVGTFMVLCSEIKKWFNCHSSILHDEDLNLRDRLNWYSFGIINRFKTAQNFIYDRSVNIKERFQLSCEYYFENRVHVLWREMSAYDRFSFQMYLPRTRSMELWLDVLERNVKMDWEQILLNIKSDFFHGNYLGIRHYFPKLRTRNMRYLCILNALRSGRLHHFDLYFCVSRMKDYELNVMLINLRTTEVIKLFECFLEWPFQIIFLDVVDKFKRHIHEELFLDLIYTIECDKLRNGYFDYSYTNLLERVWNSAPIKFKNYVKKDIILYEILIETFERLAVSRLWKSILK